MDSTLELEEDGSVGARSLARHLCVRLGADEFAIPLSHITEVAGGPSVVPVPFLPAHALGVMNLKGQILTTLDLGLCLGLAACQWGDQTSAVICQVQDRTFAVIVDEVVAVWNPNLDHSHVKPLESLKRRFVKSIFRRGTSTVAELNIEDLIYRCLFDGIDQSMV